MSRDFRKEELRAELAAARKQFSGNWTALKSDANIPARARESIREKRGVWIGGAVAFGFVLSLMRRRKKEVFVDAKTHKKVPSRKKAGILMALARLIFGILKPTLTAYATRQLASFAALRLENRNGAAGD